MWFVKEGLEAKQELSKYQVVGLRSAAPGEKGEKNQIFKLEIREAAKSRPLLCGIYLKGGQKIRGHINKSQRETGQVS